MSKPLFSILLAALPVAATVCAQTSSTRWTPLDQVLPSGIGEAALIGPKAKTDLLHISVSIPYRDPAGIQAFVDSVSDPRSKNYRKFITPEEVGRRFGQADATVKNISDYLSSFGMKIRRVAKTHLTVVADATVGQAQAAFNTSIQEFSKVLPGMATPSRVFSYTSALSVPAEIRPYVHYIGGMENIQRPKPLGQNPISPANFRSFYGTATLFANGSQGAGRTIGISNFDGYNLSNIAPWCSDWGLPQPPSVIIEAINSGVTGNGGLPHVGEGDLDIQCTIGMAPASNLIIYDDFNDSDLIKTLTTEVDENSADIITESYGWASSSFSFYDSAHAQHMAMSALGITYLCASGDSGTINLLPYAQGGTPYPDMDPEVLVVGGLTTNTNVVSGNPLTLTCAESIASQVGWPGSGGGWDTDAVDFNVRPSYQVGTGLPTNIPFRLVPDVALNADPNTPFWLYLEAGTYGDGNNTYSIPSTGMYYGFGGTSAASPTFAGCLAVAEQQLILNGVLGGNLRLGRLNDLIYSFNGNTAVFNDITSGSNGTLPNGNTSSAGAGWDTVTGWGQMIFYGFVNAVSNLRIPTSLTLSPSTVAGGGNSIATVTINAPAPVGGTTVHLSSSSPSATVPAVTTIGAGATTSTFGVLTTSVSTNQTANISAGAISANHGLVTTSASLTITAPGAGLSSVSVSPASVIGGTSSNGTVTLGSPAPAGGSVVSLSVGSGASVPSSVTVAAGATSATFTITTTGQASTVNSTITASLSGTSKSATLMITPAALVGVVVSPTSIGGGNSVTGTVSLNGAAPSSGATIALTSSSANAGVPASVVIASGTSSATFMVSTKVVPTSSTVTITAGYNGTNQTATLTIQPASLASISLSPQSVVGGSTTPVTCTVLLTGLASSAGATVKLTSSVPSLVTVPASEKIAGGSSSLSFKVTHKLVTATKSVTITASYNGIKQTATLTLNPFQVVSINFSPTSVLGGAKSTGSLLLNAEPGASGAISVKLSSSSKSVTVPATVSVKVNELGATFTASTTGVASTTVATVTASHGTSSQHATLTVQPPVFLSFTVSPITVKGTATTVVTGTVVLTGIAPPSGLIVKLSSSNTSAATVPVSVTILAGKTTATFKVTHKKVTTQTAVTLTATALGTTKTATITVTP